MILCYLLAIGRTARRLAAAPFAAAGTTEASPSLYADDTNNAVDARDIDEGSGTPSSSSSSWSNAERCQTPPPSYLFIVATRQDRHPSL
jgi:hypothetical protein